MGSITESPATLTAGGPGWNTLGLSAQGSACHVTLMRWLGTRMATRPPQVQGQEGAPVPASPSEEAWLTAWPHQANC